MSSDRLNEIILKKIGFKHKDVLVHAGIGEDSAVIDFGKDVLVISSDPITGAEERAGYLAVHVACNDLAASGAKPVGIQVVLLLPPSIQDKDIALLMEEIDATAQSINVEILGGHTEVLSHVNKPIIVITAVGKASKDRYVTSSGAVSGDDLVLTKGVGIEGTFILANDYEDMLLKKGVPLNIIRKAQNFGEKISVLKEGLLASRLGVNAMHDVTEGGLYGALDEMARASKTGFIINYNDVLINQETKIITDVLGIDPLGLISSGSMLISVKDSTELLNELNKEGIKAVKIGNIIDKEKLIVGPDGEKEKFVWSNKDELWSFMENNP